MLSQGRTRPEGEAYGGTPGSVHVNAKEGGEHGTRTFDKEEVENSDRAHSADSEDENEVGVKCENEWAPYLSTKQAIELFEKKKFRSPYQALRNLMDSNRYKFNDILLIKATEHYASYLAYASEIRCHFQRKGDYNLAREVQRLWSKYQDVKYFKVFDASFERLRSVHEMGYDFLVNAIAGFDDCDPRSAEDRVRKRLQKEDPKPAAPRCKQRISVNTPPRGHVLWADAFAVAREQDAIYLRLSMPDKERSAMRTKIADAALEVAQNFVRQFEPKAKDANKEYGILIEFICSRISMYPVAKPPDRADAEFWHLMTMGRFVRNTSVHVSRRGEECKPWGNDLVIVTRCALLLLITRKLTEIHPDTQGKAEMVEAKFLEACALSVATSRVAKTHPQHLAAARAAVITPDGGQMLGNVRSEHVCTVLDEMKLDAEVELKRTLRDKYGIRSASTQLRALLRDLEGAPQKGHQRHLWLYGGVNLRDISKWVQYSSDAAISFTDAPAEMDIAKAVYLLGSFIELFLSINSTAEIIKKYCARLEAVLCAVLPENEVVAVEGEKMNEDGKWMTKHCSLASEQISSDSEVEPLTIPDPFIVDGGTTAGSKRVPDMPGLCKLEDSKEESVGVQAPTCPPKKPEETVTQTSDVDQMLRDLGLLRYRDVMLANDVTINVIGLMDRQDFEQLGISLGHRVCMQAYCKERVTR